MPWTSSIYRPGTEKIGHRLLRYQYSWGSCLVRGVIWSKEPSCYASLRSSKKVWRQWEDLVALWLNMVSYIERPVMGSPPVRHIQSSLSMKSTSHKWIEKEFNLLHSISSVGFSLHMLDINLDPEWRAACDISWHVVIFKMSKCLRFAKITTLLTRYAFFQDESINNMTVTLYCTKRLSLSIELEMLISSLVTQSDSSTT